MVLLATTAMTEPSTGCAEYTVYTALSCDTAASSLSSHPRPHLPPLPVVRLVSQRGPVLGQLAVLRGHTHTQAGEPLVLVICVHKPD